MSPLESADDLPGRPIVTAADLAWMAPDEVDPWQASIVTDAARVDFELYELPRLSCGAYVR